MISLKSKNSLELINPVRSDDGFGLWRIVYRELNIGVKLCIRTRCIYFSFLFSEFDSKPLVCKTHNSCTFLYMIKLCHYFEANDVIVILIN